MVPGAAALPSAVVLRGHLSAPALPLGRRTGSSFPQPGDAVDGLGVLPLSPAGDVQRSDAPDHRVRTLGPAPPGLPISASTRRLGSMGILSGHSAGAGGGRGDS